MKKGWNMQEKFRKFMIGRYGVDELSIDTLRLSLLFFVLSLFIKETILPMIGMGLVLFSYIRAFSKNTVKRYAERNRYLPLRQKFMQPLQRTKRKISEGKTYRFYRCDVCNTELRVPKGKGKVKITCPKCGHVFEKRV